MRRIWLFIFSLLGLAITILPVAAQDSSIINMIDNRDAGDLTWLKQAFETAPEVLDLLDSGEPYTFFVPNDNTLNDFALQNNIATELILKDEALITNLLKYHIIEGSFTAEQLTEQSGRVVPTVLDLEGAFISFRDNNGQIAINNFVSITEGDIEVGNIIVHIVDNVLRNRVIDDNLAQFVAQNQTATEEATEASTPEATETPVTLAVANIRFAHFASDSASLDIYLNDMLILEDFTYPTLSDFSSFSPDSYEIRLQIHDDESDESQLEVFTVDLNSGDFTTFVITSSDGDVFVNQIEEDYSDLSLDSRVLIYHALADAPSVDVAIGDVIVLEKIAFGDHAALDVDTLSLDLSVFATGDSEDIIFEESDLKIAEGQYVFLALVGTVDGARLISVSLDAKTIADLQEDTGTDVEEVTETPEAPSTETVLDILKADDRFSGFLEALNASNPTVFNRLASRNLTNITVLAPSNQAFVNLYAEVSERRVFGNQSLLTQVMQYHIVEGELLASDFLAAGGTSITTILQPVQAFAVRVNGDRVFLNNSVRIVEFDIQASNGVIHIINQVLLPQAAVTAWGF